MPSYYDESSKTWYCKFYYTDYTGAKKQKKKRGFKLQREAKEWERAFLERLQGSMSAYIAHIWDKAIVLFNCTEVHITGTLAHVAGSNTWV